MTHISVVETSGYNFLRLRHFMEKFSLFRHSDIKEHKVDSKACKRKNSVAVFFFLAFFLASTLLCTDPSIYIKT